MRGRDASGSSEGSGIAGASSSMGYVSPSGADGADEGSTDGESGIAGASSMTGYVSPGEGSGAGTGVVSPGEGSGVGIGVVSPGNDGVVSGISGIVWCDVSIFGVLGCGCPLAKESQLGENGQFGIVVVACGPDARGIVHTNGAHDRHLGGGGATHGVQVGAGLSAATIFGGGGACISLDRNGTGPQFTKLGFTIAD
jgi:hypothetical protein